MEKNKKAGKLGIAITIIVLIFLVILTNTEGSNLSYVENATSKLIMPIQNGLTYLKNKVSKNDTFFTDIKNLKKENEDLKEEKSKLEQSLREMENIKTENETLKEYLGLTEKYSKYQTIPGYVINRDISNYSKNIVINIGSKDGVEENMTVISDAGLVGYISSVEKNTSKVQTIVDSASSTSSLMSTTKDSIVCKGTLEENSMLKAMYIPTDATIIQGDSVETSGIGGIYPKGIHIGTVKRIVNTNNIVDRYAMVETAVNFDKLQTVLVIKNQ